MDTSKSPKKLRAVTAQQYDHENGVTPPPLPVYQKIVLMDERPKSWNTLKRLHWSKWQKEVERCQWLILEALGRKLPAPLDCRVDLTVTVYYKNRPHDTSNIPEKLYEDGLVAAGLLTDDSREYVRRITKESAVDKKNPRIEIEIVAVEGE